MTDGFDGDSTHFHVGVGEAVIREELGKTHARLHAGDLDAFLDDARGRVVHFVADIRVFRSPLRAVRLERGIMPSLIDELPVIALLCAFAEGESVISGAEELRVKESDRIRTTADMINALGGDCTPTQDGFVIRGKRSLAGGCVRPCGDHRIAMSGAVGLAASERGGTVEGADCVNISFPNFFEYLDGTRA